MLDEDGGVAVLKEALVEEVAPDMLLARIVGVTAEDEAEGDEEVELVTNELFSGLLLLGAYVAVALVRLELKEASVLPLLL